MFTKQTTQHLFISFTILVFTILILISCKIIDQENNEEAFLFTSILSEDFEKASEICVIPKSKSVQIISPDDSSWASYIPESADDMYKGVFIKERTITLYPYSIGQFEVTQELYETVMGNNPSSFITNPSSGEVQKLRPVDQASWYEILVFCNKLSQKYNLEPCYSINNTTNTDLWGEIPSSTNEAWDKVICNFESKGFRLPTEAEWEFAARGGDQSKAEWEFAFSGIQTTKQQIYSDTDNIIDAELDKVAWYVGNANGKTHEVGLKVPNSIGLYDMSGNLTEFCWDIHGKIVPETVTNPQGANLGTLNLHVIRGGCRTRKSYFCCVSYRRESASAFSKSNILGFRIARSL